MPEIAEGAMIDEDADAQSAWIQQVVDRYEGPLVRYSVVHHRPRRAGSRRGAGSLFAVVPPGPE